MAYKKSNFIKQKFFNESKRIVFESTLSHNHVSVTEIAGGIKKEIVANKHQAANRLGKKYERVPVLNQKFKQDTANLYENNYRINNFLFISSDVKQKLGDYTYHLFNDGHNIEDLNDIYKRLLPSISVNRSYESVLPFGLVKKGYKEIEYGQVSERVTVDTSTDNLLPFNDRLSVTFSPENYIKAGKYIIGYPIVTNNIVDFENYLGPDAIMGGEGGQIKNGTIDIIDQINSLANTYGGDVFVKGIKADINSSNNDVSFVTSIKGTSLMDSKYEFKQLANDFFEDCQDAFHNAKSSNDKTISIPGYTSDGKNTLEPFHDKILNENKYSSYGSLKKIILGRKNLSMSEVGTRYLEKQNGFIGEPFTSTVTSTNFGTDSIAFRGLTRG